MNNFLFPMKVVLTVLLLGMFAYGIVSILSGRVYCKSRWYGRRENPGGYWLTIAIYLIGPPIILALAWHAA